MLTLCSAVAAIMLSHLSICTVRQDDSSVPWPGLGQVLHPVLLGQLLLLGAKNAVRLTCSMHRTLLRKDTTIGARLRS